MGMEDIDIALTSCMWAHGLKIRHSGMLCQESCRAYCRVPRS